MRYAAILLVLASCVGAPDPLGATQWEITIDRVAAMHGGRGGHVAVSTVFDSMLVIGPDGARVWEVPLPGPVLDHVVDETGAVVVMYRIAPKVLTSRLTKFGADGVAVWSHDFTEDAVNPFMIHLILDVENVAWLFYPTDLGWRFERYSPSGELLGSDVLSLSVLSFATPSTAAPLPMGGIAIKDEDGGITLLDRDGAESGRIAPGVTGFDRFDRFVVHDDGEFTVEEDGQLVRLDAAQQERWRVTGRFRLVAVPASDGSLLVNDTDGLGSSSVVEVLHHIDASGEVRREVRRDDDDVHVVDTPPPGSYRLELGSDRSVETTLISRELP